MKHLYSALLCIVVHPKRFTIMWGVSPQPPPVNALLMFPLGDENIISECSLNVQNIQFLFNVYIFLFGNGYLR